MKQTFVLNRRGVKLGRMTKKEALIEIAKVLIWLILCLLVFGLLTYFVNIWCGLLGIAFMAILTWIIYREDIPPSRPM